MNTRRLGVLLSLWSLGFALVHLAWALGWRGGVPDSAAPIAERPVFLAYDLVAMVLMVAAAAVAAALVRGHRSPLLLRATVVGSCLALLRGVPALAIDVATGSWSGLGPLADTWFVVAGLLGLALARSAQKSPAAPLTGRSSSESATRSFSAS